MWNNLSNGSEASFTSMVKMMDTYLFHKVYRFNYDLINHILTSGGPTTIKYSPLTGWLAKAICSTGPIMLEIVVLEFLKVLYTNLADA